jgi:hypothetical protein
MQGGGGGSEARGSIALIIISSPQSVRPVRGGHLKNEDCRKILPFLI